MLNHNWFPVGEEVFGSTKNTIWMMNEKNQMALFKPTQQTASTLKSQLSIK